jgi:hypothetical protein
MTHQSLNDEERADILKLCEVDGLDMTACRAMTFKQLRDMWSDYLSDTAMMEGREP